MNTKEVTMLAVVAALYTALVVVLLPISFGPIQLRVADCLIALSAVHGWPVILGVGLGAFLGNTYFGLGAIDIIFGTIANLVAGTIILKLKDRLILSLTAGSIAVGVIVGGYLWIYFPPPDVMGLNLPIWLGMIISVSLSSIIAIAGIGYGLILALKATGYGE